MMFYDLRIIPGEEFLRMDPHGHYDMHTSRQLLSDLLNGIVHSRITRVMLDTRKSTLTLTHAQVLMVAQVCKEIAPGPDEHRIAILNRQQDELDRGEVFAEIAKENGWNVRVFKDFEPAFEWLVGAENALGLRTMEEGYRTFGGTAP